MMLRRLFIATLLSAVALPALAQASVDFSSKPPITLDVASIEVESTYVPPMKEPNVDHLLPLTPSNAVRLWVSQRLKAGGTAGRARVIIHDAAIVEQDLERTEGVRGWFTKDQSQKYEGRIRVEIVVDGTARGYAGSASAAVARSTTVTEDISLNEREKTMMALVNDLATDLDGQLEPAIRTNLFPILVMQQGQP